MNILSSVGIFGVIGIILAICAAYKVFRGMWWDDMFGRDVTNFFFASIMAPMVSLLMIIICCGLGMIPHYICGETTYPEYKSELVAVRDGKGIDGFASGFIVMSVRIKDQDYFTFYEKTGENSYEKSRVETSKTVIHEFEKNSGESPRLVWNERDIKSWIWIGHHHTSSLRGKYHLHIPEGSIVREFSLR